MNHPWTLQATMMTTNNVRSTVCALAENSAVFRSKNAAWCAFRHANLVTRSGAGVRSAISSGTTNEVVLRKPPAPR